MSERVGQYVSVRRRASTLRAAVTHGGAFSVFQEVLASWTPSDPDRAP
jgi:hypothetical protein